MCEPISRARLVEPARRACAGRSGRRVRGSEPRITFSSTVRLSASMKCWWTMPMPAAIAARGRPEGDLRAVDRDRAGVRLVHAVQRLHQRRLAGTVLPDDGVDRAGPHREPDVVVGDDAGEAFLDAVSSTAERRTVDGRWVATVPARVLRGHPLRARWPGGVRRQPLRRRRHRDVRCGERIPDRRSRVDACPSGSVSARPTGRPAANERSPGAWCPGTPARASVSDHGPAGRWTGRGWTGQPVADRWARSVRGRPDRSGP